MHGSYRGIIIAAVGWLIVSASPPQQVANPEQAQAQQQTADSLSNIADTYRKQAERAERSKEGDPCQPGDDKRYSDLCAQWKAADAASLAAWLTGASFVAVLLALYLAFRSNAIAHDTAKRQLRAYIRIDRGDVPHPSTLTDGGAKFSPINYGQTPAIETSSWAMFFVGPATLPADHQLPDKWESVGKAGLLHREEDSNFTLHVHLTGAEAATVVQSGDGDKLYLVVKIEYKDVFGAKHIEQSCAVIRYGPSAARSEPTPLHNIST